MRRLATVPVSRSRIASYQHSRRQSLAVYLLSSCSPCGGRGFSIPMYEYW